MALFCVGCSGPVLYRLSDAFLLSAKRLLVPSLVTFWDWLLLLSLVRGGEACLSAWSTRTTYSPSFVPSVLLYTNHL